MDDEYRPLLRAAIFAVIYMGLEPRVAVMDRDCATNRLEKIIGLMKESKYSIHDLSRMVSTKANEFSRMNMPFELGLDYGFKCNNPKTKLGSKVFLILENQRYAYKKALSDISGWDIECHEDNCVILVQVLREWFCEIGATSNGGTDIDVWDAYNYANNAAWDAMGRRGKTGNACNKMPLNEYIDFIKDWRSKIT